MHANRQNRRIISRCRRFRRYKCYGTRSHIVLLVLSTFGGGLVPCASQCLPSLRYIIPAQIALPSVSSFFFFCFFPPHPALYIHPHLFSLCLRCRYSPSIVQTEQKQNTYTFSVLPHLGFLHQIYPCPSSHTHRQRRQHRHTSPFQHAVNTLSQQVSPAHHHPVPEFPDHIGTLE